MKIIVCIAKNNGVLFNKRRVSRDESVVNDIVSNTPKLTMSEYSEKLFDGKVINADGEIYFFVEENFADIDKVDEIILYKWNRDYPADTFFEFDKNDFTLTETCDFAGKSHERITKEVWKRK